MNYQGNAIKITRWCYATTKVVKWKRLKTPNGGD